MGEIFSHKAGWYTLNQTHTPGYSHLDQHSAELCFRVQVHCQAGWAAWIAPSVQAWEGLGHAVCFSSQLTFQAQPSSFSRGREGPVGIDQVLIEIERGGVTDDCNWERRSGVPDSASAPSLHLGVPCHVLHVTLIYKPKAVFPILISSLIGGKNPKIVHIVDYIPCNLYYFRYLNVIMVIDLRNKNGVLWK